MPARLKIKIMGGRHLPVMDKSSYTSDAFVEVIKDFVFILFKSIVKHCLLHSYSVSDKKC